VALRGRFWLKKRLFWVGCGVFGLCFWGWGVSRKRKAIGFEGEWCEDIISPGAGRYSRKKGARLTEKIIKRGDLRKTAKRKKKGSLKGLKNKLSTLNILHGFGDGPKYDCGEEGGNSNKRKGSLNGRSLKQKE